MQILKTIILFSFICVMCWITFCLFTLPDLSGLGNKTRKPSISVLGNNNKIIGSLGDVYAGSINQDEITKHLTNAVVVIEDKRFYSHSGIDFKGLARAILFNIKERRYAQGASTITQQLSKLIFLDKNKNLSRKLRELVISFYLEYKYSKQEILVMYLNRVYLGSGLYGVKAASRRYFSKTPDSLTIAESAILAGLLKSPSRLSPLVNKTGSIRRANLIVTLLLKEGLINQTEIEKAQIELKKYEKKFNISEVVLARYFIDWVYTQTPDEVLRSKKDLLIKSTLNSYLQNIVNTAIKEETKKVDAGIQTAVIVMDYKGAIKALKGGRDWNKSKFNRATQSKRQIGSIFKTYVYLTALSIGYKLEDTVLDTPIIDNKWKPKNYGNKYEGEISLERAFAKSSNVAAVKISEKVGRELIIRQTKKLGVISKIPNNPSMPLGVASMSLLEVVGSYGAICGEGRAIIPFGINEIVLRNGKSFWKRTPPKRKKIISNKNQKDIKKLLREVVVTGTASKLSSLPYKVIGKTGTTQNNRDAWFIGCAKGYVVGVWAGRDDDKSMKNVFGSTLPLNIFNSIIKDI
ncbi:transglycosylase domain-containing protein [Alphaproteobacteria bacterium]|nr:transglycosylase domain-containing protein [Alphaproteobacteria bacterium]